MRVRFAGYVANWFWLVAVVTLIKVLCCLERVTPRSVSEFRPNPITGHPGLGAAIPIGASMRTSSRLLIFALLLGYGGSLPAQSCTGLCTQQVACPNGGATSVTGVVYAPNAVDPLPNIQVYIPNAPVAAFTAGVSCPVVGAVPSGSPLVRTVSAIDGSFVLEDVPVGKNIPLVLVTGRWRRQLTIPSVTACTNTKLPDDFAVLPKNHTQGDMPKIAIATGKEDAVECALTDYVGIDASEFTDAGAGGHINLFGGGGAPGSGAVLGAATPTQASLMDSASTLAQYDFLMLPSEDADYTKPQNELKNLVGYADAGGRVLSSHYSYTWMWQNPPFDTAVLWNGGPGTVDNVEFAAAQVVTENPKGGTFAPGEILAEWMALVDGFNPFELTHSFVDTAGVVPPTRTWVQMANSTPITSRSPTAELIFDTPIAPSGSGVNQCGRVLYDDFDVVAASSGAGSSSTYPNECPGYSPYSPQQQLLVYQLFNLSGDGSLPSIAPASYDFGPEAVSIQAAPETFTWTNNSNAAATVSKVSFVGSDFSAIADTCTKMVVAGGASCTVTVGFTPSALGARSATLLVFAEGLSLAALLNGTGLSTFSPSADALDFGMVAVGDSVSKTVTLTSNATVPQPLPALQITSSNGYSYSTAGCANPVPAFGSCVVTVSYSPVGVDVQFGNQGGTLTADTLPFAQAILLDGIGIPDFTLTPSALDFGSQHIGSSTTLTLTLQSYADHVLATPVFAVTGSYYAVSTAACGAAIKPGAHCGVAATFSPQNAGVFPGALADSSTSPVYAGLNASLTGIAGDFSISVNPNSGSVIAGEAIQIKAIVNELEGADTGITLTCTLEATAAACALPQATVASATMLASSGYITTTSEYKVIGYTGTGGGRGLWLIGLGTGCLVWIARRKVRPALRGSLWLLVLAGIGLSLTACSGLLPAKNASYTAPGTYVVTVTATDGSLVHSATYSLTVNAK